MEIWLPVLKLYSYKNNWELDKHYTFEQGEYFISNLGRLIVRDEIVHVKPDKFNTLVNSMQGKRFKRHQIVLQTFMPNGIKDFVVPDHINRFNRLDNSLSNLRWADRKVQYDNRDNVLYKYKKILCLNTNKEYSSCQEAEEDLNLTKNTVSRVARGDRKSIHGYKFKYI